VGNDKRTVLALVLIALVTLLYLYTQKQYAEQARRQREEQARRETPAPPTPEGAPPAVRPAEKTAVPAPAPPVAEPPVEALQPEPVIEPSPGPARPAPSPEVQAQPPARPAPTEERGVEKQFTLQREGRRLTFSTLGAALVDVELVAPQTKPPLHLVEPPEVTDEGRWPASLLLRPADEDGPPMAEVNYEHAADTPPDVVEFHRTFAGGLEVTKRFEVPEGARHVLLSVTFENTGLAPRDLRYQICGAVRVKPEYFDRTYIEALVATRSGPNGQVKADRKAPKSVLGAAYQEEDNPQRPIIWVGTANKYFAALLKPLPEKDQPSWVRYARIEGLPDADALRRADGTIEKTFDNAVASIETRKISLAPGDRVTHRYLFYVGPKDRRLFGRTPEYADFRNAISYGWFEIFSIPLLMLLDALHRLLPNYGVAIILLTLIVRALLHPLTRKSQISMRRMQQLQPEIKKLQEKYKGDRQRLGKEQMELFRKHGVNPMSGCLPMLFQMPIIIGLFRAIQLSVELRGAPFILWIHDLSRPDTVGHIGNVPVRILPIAMIASMLAQMLLQPKPPDPQQARQQKTMMIVMTGMFALLFYRFASGVVLYWLTSTFVGIIEQRLIKRSLARMEAEARSGGKKEKA